MGKYGLEEIHELIDEASDWGPSKEKDMMMEALGRMLLSRQGQLTYKDGVYFERNQMRIPNLSDKVFHLFGFHTWLEYDDANVFDCTRRICLICGRTESSPLRREYGYDGEAGYKLNLKQVLKFIKEVTT